LKFPQRRVFSRRSVMQARMPDRRLRVRTIAAHPVQYQVPLFRRMAAHDPDFGANVKWDVPLLDGYAWTHVPNRGSGGESFLGLRNQVMSFSVLIYAWRVVRALKGSPWFPLAFMIFWYAFLLLLPFTFQGLQAYQDFVWNAYLWLLLGILFRLPKLALSAQFTADTVVAAQAASPRWTR
jgi:hypothetical protein